MASVGLQKEALEEKNKKKRRRSFFFSVYFIQLLEMPSAFLL